MDRIYEVSGRFIDLTKIESIEITNPPYYTVRMQSGDIIYGIGEKNREPEIIKKWRKSLGE